MAPLCHVGQMLESLRPHVGDGWGAQLSFWHLHLHLQPSTLFQLAQSPVVNQAVRWPPYVKPGHTSDAGEHSCLSSQFYSGLQCFAVVQYVWPSKMYVTPQALGRQPNVK